MTPMASPKGRQIAAVACAGAAGAISMLIERRRTFGQGTKRATDPAPASTCGSDLLRHLSDENPSWLFATLIRDRIAETARGTPRLPALPVPSRPRPARAILPRLLRAGGGTGTNRLHP